LAAQSDSVMKLNRAGRYEQALTLARTGLSADATNDERCVLRLGSLIAVTRLGAYETASRDLSTLDSQCATNPVVQKSSELPSIRKELALPPLPKTGLDFTAIDQFWKIADLLTKDGEPSAGQWRTMFSTVGYRLSMINVSTTRSDMEIALMPSRRA